MFTEISKNYNDYSANFGDTKFILKWDGRYISVTGKCIISRHHMHGRLVLYSDVKNGQISKIYDFTNGRVEILQCITEFNKQIQQLYEPGGQKYLQSQEAIINLSKIDKLSQPVQ